MHGAELVPNRIFVAGLPQNTDQAELLEYFANISGSAANITEINIINEKSGLSKGYGFVTFVSESEAKRVLGMDTESFVFKETKLIVSSAYMRPKYNPNFNNGHHKANQTNYQQSSQYFYNSKNLPTNNHSAAAVAQEQKSECNSVESSSFTSPTPLTSSTHTCNTLDMQEGQEAAAAQNQPQADVGIETNTTLLTSSSSSSSSASSSTTTSSSSLNVNRINNKNGLDSKVECAHDSNNNNPSESNLNQTNVNNAQPKSIDRGSSFKSSTRDGNVVRRARNDDSSGSSTAAEYHQQARNFNYQYQQQPPQQQRQPFNRFNLNKKGNARQFEQQLHIQTNPVHLSSKNPSLTAAAAAIATASSNSGTLSPTSLKQQQSLALSQQLQYPSSNAFMRVGTSPTSFTKVKQKSANLEKMPNTSNLVGSVGSIVNKASMDAFNKVPNENQAAQSLASSENATNGSIENKQTTNAAYSLAATYANRSASINSSTLQAQQHKPEAKQSQVVSAQRQRNAPKSSHTSPPHSFDYSLYKHQQQQQQQAQMVQMPAAIYPTAHAFYMATATQYDSSNMKNQQPKQYVHSASKQAISNNAATISNAFETVVSSSQQMTESNNEPAYNYYAYNQTSTNKAVEEMDEAMKSKLNLANTVKNAEYDNIQVQQQQQQQQHQQIPTVYYYCPPSVTGQDVAFIQPQPQQQQQSLSANPCYYYYTPISPAATNAAIGHQTPQPQQMPQQSQQFIQTQPAQPKQTAQTSQPINYLAHYGFVDPYTANANVPVIQPQAQAYYAANVPLAQYPQASYYLNSQQFMSMALNQTPGTTAANGLPQTSYQSYAYVQPQVQQSSHLMKPIVNSHVQQQQRPPSAPHHYHHYQSRSNTPKPAVYAEQYMMDPSTFGMASSSSNTTYSQSTSNANRGGKMKYSHSNRVPANQHRVNNHHYQQQQGHYAKSNRTHDMANKSMSAFGAPPTNQIMMSNQQAQQEGLVEQTPTN